MGNSAYTLPRGTVCDSCNQYFARKVERPVLESPIFRHIRAGLQIPNKRGRLPIWLLKDGINRPNYRMMGRFLTKLGLEIIAFRVLHVDGWNDEIVDKQELDELRNFARFNIGADWPFTVRTLHPANEIFDDGDQNYHLFHEFDILLTKRFEYYLVLSLFGVEFVTNLGGRVLDGYQEWLEENQYASPLYAGNNDQ